MPTLAELSHDYKEIAARAVLLENKIKDLEEEGLGLNLEPTKSQREIRSLAQEVCEKELRPHVFEMDESEEYPEKFIRMLGSLGFLGVYLPEEYGGLGKGVLSLILVMEEIAKVCPGTAAAFGVNALGTMPILISGTGDQKQKYLPKIASGEILAAFCLTETESGSDAFAMKLKAVLDGDSYVLNGQKHFITSASRADIYSVFGVTNPNRGARGISGFIVEKDTQGFTFGKKERKYGLHCSETRAVYFDNCRVPKENLIGGLEGIGAITALNTLNRSRIVVSAQGLGLAEGAYARALEYAKERKQFGQSIVSFQAIQHKLADMAMQIEATRGLVYQAAWYADNDYPKDKIAKFGAMAKCFSSEAAFYVAKEAVQICGGIGFMREFGVGKYLADAPILSLYEGTSEIQRNEIAQILIKESNKK